MSAHGCGLCGQNRANTLVITHSPVSVFHLCRVPDPQHWGSRQDWVNPSDELQSPWSPHWLLFSAAAQRDRGATGKARQIRCWHPAQQPWREPAPLSYQGASQDCLWASVCLCVCTSAVRLWSLVDSFKDGSLGGQMGLSRVLRVCDPTQSTWFILGARMWAFRGGVFLVCWSRKKSCQCKLRFWDRGMGTENSKSTWFSVGSNE